jgi:hypothetical protein
VPRSQQAPIGAEGSRALLAARHWGRPSESGPKSRPSTTRIGCPIPGQRDTNLAEIKADLRLTSLLGDPRYKAFLRKMDLPE